MAASKRMEAIASFLPMGCKMAADIGTDHGYLPIYAVQRGLVDSFIAMDVKEGPLAKAKKNIKEAGLEDKIKLRLSDGFAQLKEGEADCIVISGLGGKLMVRILDEGKDKAKGAKKLILSPQSEPFKVRRWLFENQFVIVEEDMLLEDGKEYVIITARPGRMEPLSLLQERYGPCLLKNRHPLLLEKLKKEQERTKSLIGELSWGASDTEEIKSRLFQLAEKEKLLEEALSTFTDEKRRQEDGMEGNT